MADLTVIETEARLTFCADPECVDADGHRSLAEPEQDGEHQWSECVTCGYQFGWAKVQLPQMEGACAIGVPEAVRVAFATAQTAPPGDAPVGTPVTLTRKPT